MAPLVQALSDERQVIAVELQGHGRTVDTNPQGGNAAASRVTQ